MAGCGLQRVLQRPLDLPGGVAGEGERAAAGPGSAHPSRRAASKRAGRDARSDDRSRTHRLERVGARVFRALIAMGLACLAPAAASGADERIRNLRVWPSQDYTRITIETETEVRYELTALRNPERLVLDLENVDFL